MDDVPVRLSLASSPGRHARRQAGRLLNRRFPSILRRQRRERYHPPPPRISPTARVAASAAANAPRPAGHLRPAQINRRGSPPTRTARSRTAPCWPPSTFTVIIKSPTRQPVPRRRRGLGWQAGTVYAEVYKNLAEAGVSVNAAAGNSYSERLLNYSGRGAAVRDRPRRGHGLEPRVLRVDPIVASVNNQDALPTWPTALKQIVYRKSRGLRTPSYARRRGRHLHVIYGIGDGQRRWWRTPRHRPLDDHRPGTAAARTAYGADMTLRGQGQWPHEAGSKPAALILGDSRDADIRGDHQSRTMPTVAITKKEKDA